jgi:hypothetical protein
MRNFLFLSIKFLIIIHQKNISLDLFKKGICTYHAQTYGTVSFICTFSDLGYCKIYFTTSGSLKIMLGCFWTIDENVVALAISILLSISYFSFICKVMHSKCEARKV